MVKLLFFLVASLLVVSLEAFVSRAPTTTNAVASRGQTVILQEGDNKNDGKGGIFGAFMKDLQGMAANLDDVVDDFVFKRMGAGEQWYGKRKYQPSEKFQEDYKGMGLSDKVRIDVARARKEEYLAERERRRRESEKRQ